MHVDRNWRCSSWDCAITQHVQERGGLLDCSGYSNRFDLAGFGTAAAAAAAAMAWWMHVDRNWRGRMLGSGIADVVSFFSCQTVLAESLMMYFRRLLDMEPVSDAMLLFCSIRCCTSLVASCMHN